MDGGNSPRRVVNRLFYFLRFRRPAPRTPQDNAKCNNSRQRARKARRARKRKTRNSTHVWSSNPESEEKRKIVDGDGKREKKVVTGPSVFICSTVAFSFTCIEFQQLTVRAFPFFLFSSIPLAQPCCFCFREHPQHCIPFWFIFKNYYHASLGP